MSFDELEEWVSDPKEREAVDWIIRKDRGLSEEEARRFDRWCRENPEHQEAMARMNNVWSRFDTYRGLKDTVEGGRSLRFRRWLTQFPRIAATTGVAASVILGIVFWPGKKPGDLALKESVYRATIDASSYASHILPDGSIVELNGNTQADVRYTDDERSIWLIKGEAHFDVTEDPSRPFIVHAGSAAVRAVGTAFNVKYSDQDTVELLVTEGIVKVGQSEGGLEEVKSAFIQSPLKALLVGERAQASLTKSTSWKELEKVDEQAISELLNWRPAAIAFSNAPLEDVVNAFNARSEKKLIIEDPELANLPITVSFRSDNVGAFTRLVELTSGILAEQTEDGTILLKRR